jgi:hypothetical protein
MVASFKKKTPPVYFMFIFILSFNTSYVRENIYKYISLYPDDDQAKRPTNQSVFHFPSHPTTKVYFFLGLEG